MCHLNFKLNIMEASNKMEKSNDYFATCLYQWQGRQINFFLGWEQGQAGERTEQKFLRYFKVITGPI